MNNGHDHPAPGDSFRRISQLIQEYKEYGQYYLTARWDAIKVSLRQAGVYAALGVIGVVALWATVTMAIVLTLLGAAMGLASVLGGRVWLGSLIIGLAVLLLLVSAIAVGLAILKSSTRKHTERKYEQRQARERHRFGRNVQDLAARQ